MKKLLRIVKYVILILVVSVLFLFFIVGLNHIAISSVEYAKNIKQERRERPLVTALVILQKPVKIKLIAHSYAKPKGDGEGKDTYFNVEVSGIKELEGKVFSNVLVEFLDVNRDLEYSTIELVDDEDDDEHLKVVFSFEDAERIIGSIVSRNGMYTVFVKHRLLLEIAEEE